MNIFHSIIILLLIVKIQSFLYLSIDVNNSDYCITRIYTKKNNIEYTYFDSNKNDCHLAINNPIVENKKYEFDEIIYLNIYDNINNTNFINITIRLNEYIIKNSNPKFLHYLNFNEEEYTYTYTFQINSLSDLNDEEVEIDYDYFGLTAENAYNISIYYKENEFELINFKNKEIFYIKKYQDLDIDITNYFFKVYFDKEIIGELIGLNLLDTEMKLNNGSSFKVTETKGLKYRMATQEKNNNEKIHLKLYIQVFNNPYNDNWSKNITELEEFNFYISLYGDYLKCLNEEIDSDSYSCTNISKEVLNSNNDLLYDIINKIDIYKKYNIIGKDIIIHINPFNETYFTSTFENFNLNQCDEIIKQKYVLSSSSKITNYIEIKSNNINNLRLLEETMQYLVYDDKKTFFNFSLCIEEFLTCTKYEQNSKIIYCTLKKTKEELVKNMSKLMEKIEIGKIYEIKGENYNIKISPANETSLHSSLSSSLTYINFDKCESELRAHYRIDKSKYITLLQLEISNTNPHILINKVEYQAYDDNKNLLNLALCENLNDNVTIVYGIKKSLSINTTLISSFKNDKNIDLFNITESFFTDLCYAYSEEGNDITLDDRITYFYQNYSLCEKGCTYKEMNLNEMSIKCECKIKTVLDINEINFDDLLKYEKKNANPKILKCYNLVFSIKDKGTNAGFWIFTIIVVVEIKFIISHCDNGTNNVKKSIMKEMGENGYMKIKADKNSISKKYIHKYRYRIQNNVQITNKSETNNAPPPRFKTEDSVRTNKIKKLSIKKGKPTNIYEPKETSKIRYINDIIKKNNNNSNSKNNSNNNISKINYLINSKNILINYKFKNFDKILNQKNEFYIININLNDERVYKPRDSNQILNNFNYREAVKYDVRPLWSILYIFLLSKQIIFYTFFFKSPFELFSLRISLLLFILSIDLGFNALLYSDDKISAKYHYDKNVCLFSFTNNIGKIFLITFIGIIFMYLITNTFTLTKKVRDIFKREEKHLLKDKNYKITEEKKKEIFNEIETILDNYISKSNIFIIFVSLIILFFWYYVVAFCHVYNNTQSSWLLDSLLSFILRGVLDFFISLILSILYIYSINSNKLCIYKIVLFIYSFG